MQSNKSKNYDFVLIPGAPYFPDKENTLLNSRISWGLELYREKRFSKFFLSGASVKTPYCEAEVMEEILLENGVKSENTIIDIEAMHTSENIEHYLNFLIKQNIPFGAIATDNKQARRIKFYLKINDIKNIDILPFYQTIDPTEELIIPQNISKNDIQDFKSERANYSFWKKIKGKLGI